MVLELVDENPNRITKSEKELVAKPIMIFLVLVTEIIQTINLWKTVVS